MKNILPKGLLTLLALVSTLASADVAQEPLYLGSGNVPGNLAITLSVEYPTVNSVANLGSFDPDATYIGYFDSAKCYDYVGSATESDRHFVPHSITSNQRCPGPYWSGNYLNWAATQTIDPFRWALTGGLRVKDTPTETWVEKARHSGQGNYFPERTISGASLVADVTPFNADWIKTDINGLGKQMQFELPSGASLIDASTPNALVNTFFYDTDFKNGDWSNYGSGAVSQANDPGNNQNKVLLKKNHNDPDGGYTAIGTLSGRNFILSGKFYYAGGGGDLVRLAISDGNASGYGFQIGSNSIGVEKRSNGSAHSMGSSSSFSRSDDTWYKFDFIGRADNTFELKIYDLSDQPLADVVSSADSSYNSFSRLYVHGGHDFYLDDLKIETVSGASASWPYASAGTSNVYDASVRVKVCDPTVGLESNCKAYSQGWKPEGLLQEYADKIRYSVFGYLNDSNGKRDGGVLRARQTFIGMQARDPVNGWQSNSAPEWDSTTGVLLDNPDPADATATSSYFGVNVDHSGVINYINKFGELNNNEFKIYDPVSELYYTATRYFRGLGHVSSYDTRYPSYDSSPSSSTREKWVDGFPVVRDWHDPIQYSCQKNVILGIGDVYTHKDQNLPGSPFSNDSNEPARPPEVSADTAVDVQKLNDQVGSLEGLDLTDSTRFGATRNSGYMIGLAYDAHTRDIRDDWAGKQTISTYWVDVLENRKLEDIGRNQYWLTAKYGGFVPRCPASNPACSLPVINGPYDSNLPNSLPEQWWFTNGQVLTQSGLHLKRTDNYYPAGQADNMVAGLKKAFADIAKTLRTTGTSLSLNSNRIKSDTLIYQALLDNTRWSGDLIAMDLTTSGAVGSPETWSAASKLDALTSTQIDSRKIFTGGDLSQVGNGSDGSLITTSGLDFKWDSLTADQKTAILAGSTDTQLGADRVDYLRGIRSNEVGSTTGTELFRQRDSRLGDIANSNPQYIYHEDFGYSVLASNTAFGTAGNDYETYRQSTSYVNKPPLIVAGANDGMLHGFNASDTGGNELFAYVPVSTFDQLHKLTDPDYIHQYFVDGTPRLGDAWLGAADGWKTLAVGTNGAGGSGVFALDVSDPTNMSKSKVLWEYKNTNMGRLIEQPALVALANGKFGVVVSSGYGAAKAAIWILDAADGSVIKEFDLPASAGDLGEPLVVDLQNDRVADRIYVGDTLGNIWRLDIGDSNTAKWDAPSTLKQGNTIDPLVVVKDASGAVQPITAPLVATYGKNNEPMLLFGTGSYYQVGDNNIGANPQIQSFYGIYDNGAQVDGRGALQKQEILAEVAKGDYSARVVTQNALSGSARGWYLDLAWSSANGGPGPVGERVVTKATLSGSQVVFSTLIPSADPCAGGGDSWIMALDLTSGGRSNTDVFDYTSDGKVDNNDSVTITVKDDQGNDVQKTVPGSGFKSKKGVAGSPATPQTSTGERRLCYAGSTDTTPTCVLMEGGLTQGRTSWRELTQQ